MEAREEVEDTDDQEALVRLHSTNRARQAELCTQLSAALGSQEWECARQLVAQLSYWVRLEEAIAAKL
jgi:DnaJ-domain-containing protein 1